MNKVHGMKSDYSPVRNDATRTVVCYHQESVDENTATWLEVYLPHKKYPNVGLKEVKEAIIADINARTRDAIVTGLVYADNDNIERTVWLSTENQHNYAESHRKAVLKGSKNYQPVTIKIGEDANGNACYRTFDTLTDFSDFIFAIDDHITACLNTGYAEKDGIDWTPYEALYPVTENSNNG